MIQKRTPLGGHLGSAGGRLGGEVVLETGTLRRWWKRAKLEPCGPKGKKGVIVVSEAMMDLPEGVWVVVMTRGALSLGVSVVVEDIFVDWFDGSKVGMGSASNNLDGLV